MCDRVRLAYRGALALLALALGLLLAACGAPASGAAQDTAGQGPAALDSCALLTKADAEALLGAPVAASSTNHTATDDPNDQRAVSQCLYHTTGDDYKRVSVLVRRGAADERARAGLQQLRDHNELGGALDPVAGLGDEAIWNHGGDADQLNVARDQYLVIASADLGKGAPTLEISKAIAQRVLERLP